jgi:hypothetical protein
VTEKSLSSYWKMLIFFPGVGLSPGEGSLTLGAKWPRIIRSELSAAWLVGNGMGGVEDDPPLSFVVSPPHPHVIAGLNCCC